MLNEAKANDLLFWASRYHLFVHWSASRSHPWDKVPKSEAAACTLEFGKLRDSDNQVHSDLQLLKLFLNLYLAAIEKTANCILQSTVHKY